MKDVFLFNSRSIGRWQGYCDVLNRMKIVFQSILLYVWQLPQNILGEILTLCYRTGKGRDYHGIRLHYSDTIPGGISLGRHIILNRKYRNDDDEKRHEWGHTRQSMMLGWLYLIVIGLPSIIWASRRRRDYYSFWTERWADRLGGVNRQG
jgi:hypothetical protein